MELGALPLTIECINSGGQLRLQVVGSSPKFQVTLEQVVRVHTTITYILCYKIVLMFYNGERMKSKGI